MIHSDRQRGVSSQQLGMLRNALVAARERECGKDRLGEVEIDGLSSRIAELEAEIAEYDLLKSGQAPVSRACTLEELPRVLVQARIASHMTQSDLARKLGLKPQQVQRYEASDYMSASLARLIDVACVLGVETSAGFDGPAAGAAGRAQEDAGDEG